MLGRFSVCTHRRGRLCDTRPLVRLRRAATQRRRYALLHSRDGPSERASERARPHRPRIAHARARMRARRGAIGFLAALRERGCLVVDGGPRLSALRDHAAVTVANGRAAQGTRAHTHAAHRHARARIKPPRTGHTGEAERAAPAHPDAAQGLARPTLAHAPQPAGVPHASGLTASRRAARCLRQSEGDQRGRAVHMPSHGHSGTDSQGTAAARNGYGTGARARALGGVRARAHGGGGYSERDVTMFVTTARPPQRRAPTVKARSTRRRTPAHSGQHRRVRGRSDAYCQERERWALRIDRRRFRPIQLSADRDVPLPRSECGTGPNARVCGGGREAASSRGHR